ncbi:MAG: GlsB/YeaQ/YmgE family stress response membrane protein [Gemmatimonadaceae bacterium]
MIWWICVGLVAGWATGKLVKGSGFGALADIVIGIIGAVIGGFVMRTLGFAGSGGFVYTILVAILGAVILLWLERLISGHRGHQL